MEKRQERNNEAKQNRKLNIDLNNKNRRINTKNLPTFILIGLIIMLIIIAIIYYVFLRYAPEMIITYSGYAVEGKTMVENLKNSDLNNVNPYLGLIEVQENDLLYKRLNSYYIGEDDKKEIDINYPIYINEGNALLNIGPTTRLITVNYEEVEGYPDFMMTDGVMYNGVDITRADGNKYIFLKSEDEIYTNVGKIKINTALNEYKIRDFSNIYFTEEYIAYYEMQDGSDASNGSSNENSDNAQNKTNNVQNWYMQYKRINDIDMDSKIEVNNETMTYKEFLERLGIIQTEENNNNAEIENTVENEIEEPTENNVEEETTTQEQNNESNTTTIETEPTEQEWQEGMWEKPTVSCTDFESGVYTIRTNLSVTDRAGVISRGVIFEIYLEGRLNRRALATQTGNIEITNLQPDTEFEIRGVFYYYDENEEEQEEEFYIGTVKTKPISALGTIDFSFQNGEIYSNKIELIHLKLSNDLNEEVIRGISRIQVEIGDVAYRLTNDQVDQLKAGEEITYQTSESLTSNSKIKYKITAFDRFGNELKAKNNEGETITSKQSPRVSITATKQDVTEVILNVTLNNKDNVSLENYRYEITNQSGEVVKQGILGNNGTASDGNKETLTFNDLDPNGYYQIIIYGDYDLDNGEGIQQNSELGRASFVTRPLASLGYMQVHIDDKEVTQNSMNLDIRIDENQTDARLLAILDNVEVVIYDRGKNVDDENNGQGEQQGTDTQTEETEVRRITFTEEQVQSLKIAEEVQLNLEQLNSNTIYRIDVITSVKQGTVETVVEDKQNLEQLITLKMPAEVQVRNQFVIGTMIDLDMRVEDPDNAVLTNQVRIEVRDKDNKLIDLSEMPTNAEYERKTYEDLTPNETYKIIVYAPQYNIGSTDATYEADYVLKEIEIVTETGISGNLDLISLEKTPTGKNLIDVSSKVNWYEKCFATEAKYGINYDESTKILTLGGTWESSLLNNYYNLSNYLGEEITISFKARTIDNTSMSIIEKESDDFTNTTYSTYYTINDLTNDWQEYTYTVTLSKTGYIGFRIANNNTSVEIQDLQAELGNRKTDYETFQYDYIANVLVTVSDARDEIETNDYYIRIYKNNEQIQELRYEEIGEDNKVENVQKTYNIESDANYQIELLVKITDRYYELDSQEFSTEGSRELKGIFNLNDFLKIQPYGEYIVLDNLDLSGASGTQYKFGNANISFEGKIDFNGYTLTKDVLNIATGWFNSSVFYSVGDNGLIENLVFDMKMNNEIERSIVGGFTLYNYGTIRNIQINLIESTEKKNTDVYLFCNGNSGTIENFVANLKVPFYANGLASLVGSNYGVIKNGYVYGKNIELLNESSSLALGSSVVAKDNNNNGIVENIYSLVSVNSVVDGDRKGSLVYGNYNNSTIQNVYSVGIGKNTNLTTGPNIYNKSSKKIYNNYYFADEIFTSELETKGNKLSLWDAQFQNQIINGDGVFNVDELVNQGYYPQLNMPDVMPSQEYIKLPEAEDADLPDILSTKVLEQGTNTVKVQFSVNNPSSAQINNIQIENLDVEILSQEYSSGKSTVIAELKNPVICVSSYDVLSISIIGAFGSSYTRPYDEGERVINVDLYKEIWNVNDWKAIKDSPTENYMLMADLNFINEGNTIALGTINGILNGNGHSISNINLINNTHVISTLNGTLENLFINNFNQEVDYGGGFIADAQTGSIVDHVHMTNAHISKTESWGVGGLFHLATYSTIRNSSVNNIEINTKGNVSDLNIGGIVGQINNTSMENCYVKGLQVNDSKGVNSGVGGIAGYGSGTSSIKSCYAEGSINSVNINVGGIIGKLAEGEVENCYSKVNILTTNNNVGGIVGIYSGTDISNISNNLSIGKIYTTSGLNSLNRIVGNESNTANNNYAYEKQLLNGYESNDAKGAILLSKEEILNLSLGDSYNYDEKDEGILPKLYNIEGIELLPNQENILVDDNTEGNADLEIESIEATKPNTTEAEIIVRINNPEEVEITGIEIEDMTVASITRNVTQNGITSITVRATPNRYYDSYKLTGIRYKADNSEEQIKEVENEIEVQFYKEIYTYEDWQTIEEGTYQNYRLMADIDFSGKSNVKNNINVNRLEAENGIYTLKNINLSYNTANTGLINNVKTSIKNIGFENITLTNTAGSDNYFGVIVSNNGDIENLSFKDINVSAKGMSYVGIIGGMASGNINNVELNNITVNAGGYTGGFIGYININIEGNINGITADYINVIGSGIRVGGLIGSGDMGDISMNYVSINNANITGQTYTGGVLGYLAYGDLTHIDIGTSEISGSSYVGGVVGYCVGAADNMDFRRFWEVKSCEITGNGSNIGGIAGYIVRGYGYVEWVVDDCNITQTSVNSQNVGGLFGCGNFIWPQRFQVSDTTVNSQGTNVGGLAGANYSNCSVGFDIGYFENGTIFGRESVGGAFGYLSYGGVNHVYINADIKAENNYAGGMIGYMDNTDMTASRNSVYIYNSMILDTKVEAQTMTGGMIGNITKEIYRDAPFYYNNYIDADVTSTNTSTGSLLIGGRADENDYITHTYIYKYSKLNGNYVYATNDNIDDSQYLVRTDLNQQSTYTNKIGIGNTSYWNYTQLQNGKYPMVADSWFYKPELQTGINLPTDPEITELNLLSNEDENDNNANKAGPNSNNSADANGISTQSIESLPSYKVYPTKVDEINIDFGDIPEGISFTYYVNGEEKETVDLEQKTYTFKYNYQDTLEIKVTNGVDEETITITPEDVRSEASLVGSNNAYLLGTSLYINGEVQSGNYVNVYEGYALNSRGQIVDIATKQTVTNAGDDTNENNSSVSATTENAREVVTTSLKQTTTSLHTYNYNGSTIETYGIYSTVNGNIKQQIYNIRSGGLSALSNSLDMKIDNYIVDNYNNKEYQTILTTEGQVEDLKEMLQYPENFLNRNIKQIVQNSDAEKTEMIVLYNTGKVIAFNYVTGDVIYENEEKADTGLADYITGSVSNIWNDYEEKQADYEKSKELAAKLAELPVSEAMQQASNNSGINDISADNTNNASGNSSTENVSPSTNANTNTDSSYITVYNADTGEYEVYSEEEILNGEDENPVSETTKIKENGLESVYNYETNEESKPKANGAVIVVAIIGIAIIALIVLRRVIVKNNNKK